MASRPTSRARPRKGRGAPIAVAYLGLALALLVAAMPSTLRPPPDPASSAAELSPDAPPDDQQESIVAALGRGTSGTAGSGAGVEGPAEAAPDQAGNSAAPPPVPPPPRFCPNGVGDPPRQVESLYSAPCAGSWQGDNGGATWKHVTATEVRIGVVQGIGSDGGMALDSDEPDEISDEPRPGESDAYRTWRVWQQYFNQNFQLWGRHLRFVVVDADQEEAATRAAAQELDERYKVFAVKSFYAPALREAARRRLVAFGGWNYGVAIYDDNQPYLTNWYIDGTRLMKLNAEYICKRLVGRPAAFAGPAIQDQERKFGVIATEYAGWGTSGGFELPAMVKQQCGIDMIVQRWSDEGEEQTLATAITQLRAAGVTTVALDVDAAFTPAFLAQADSQSYFPEWYITGTFSTDHPAFPAVLGFSRSQWAHAFGLSGLTMAQREPETDAYRAYKSIDPDNTPASTDDRVFPHLLQIVNGIQMAGPTLTPETFRHGLNAMGKRGNDPIWSVGGGFAPGDHTYADDVFEIWWDNTAPNPYLSDVSGTYRYVDCGRRYDLGAVPTTEVKVFDPAGTCIVSRGPA